MLSLQSQNVNTLLDADNLKKLTKLTGLIGCDVIDFIPKKETQPQPVTKRYVE